MIKVLVTGGAGFIGSNLCEYLLAHGYEVVCLDNFATGKIENLFPLLSQYPDRFKLIVGDIRKLSDCQKAVEGVDYVLHEAALGSVPRSIKDPLTTNETNISGFLNMLIAARDAKVKRFIYAASSSTYGDSKSLPKVEDVIGKPLSPYAITKYVNELYADVFSRTYEMECIGQDDERVLAGIHLGRKRIPCHVRAFQYQRKKLLRITLYAFIAHSYICGTCPVLIVIIRCKRSCLYFYFKQGMSFVFNRNKLYFRHRVKSCLNGFADKVGIGLWII